METETLSPFPPSLQGIQSSLPIETKLGDSPVAPVPGAGCSVPPALSTRASSEHPRKISQLQAGGLPWGPWAATRAVQSSKGAFQPLSQESSPGPPPPTLLHCSPEDDLLKEEAVQHPASSIAKPINKPRPPIQSSLKGGCGGGER